ncbi:VWA domain-containing protein [Defluviimonas aestuarii]|uniref:vWA domain-containing protein n=1 Tax=Albidovulum aestuarii TaxID=1130726 RepID=UPI00249A2A37|nr:VWA domain-containing protein [Defluviimonas aestuarii]MDI3336738.1 VWA domain-containing protein [Defluviimonas aestuarii]
MSDEFDKLRAGLKANPAPDPAAKAETLRLATENFDRHQETATKPRPNQDRPERAGVLTGVREMFTKLTTRGALAATASVAAIGIGVMIWPSLEGQKVTPQPTVPVVQEPAPAENENRLRQAETKEEFDDTAIADAKTSSDALGRAETVVEAAPMVMAEEPVIVMDEPAIALAAPAAESVATAKSANGNSPQFSGYAQSGIALPEAEIAPLPEPDTEAYANDDPNPVKIVAEEPVSTFSIDTDTASYSVIRSSLTNGYLPPKEAVRIEEMVNYFPYDYAAPDAGEAPFRASVSLFQTPWNENTQLLRIGIQGELPATDDRPPLNLVFLIDTSGSMDDPKKLPLLKQSFGLMLGQLRPEDRVAIVTYAGSAGLVLEPTAASERATILAALDRLDAGGSTAGAEGLRQAYQVAESMAEDGRIGRVLLATDGDFNVGIHDPEELKDFIAKKRDSGTYLSVLGFGRGNLDDATMQALAQNGNGTAAYIDTLSEAQKVLVDQLSGALFPIADDVKIQIEFNPAAVAEYRLIGYETRALAREDFNNDKVDAGEIGAGHQVTALYEVTPVGSPAILSDPLRYAEPTLAGDVAELGFLKLRHKQPGEEISTLIENPIPVTPGEADADANFAAAIAGMGQLLSDPKYLGEWGWDEAIGLANAVRGEDPFGYRAEAVQLMRLAQSLAR